MRNVQIILQLTTGVFDGYYNNYNYEELVQIKETWDERYPKQKHIICTLDMETITELPRIPDYQHLPTLYREALVDTKG